MLSFGDDQVIIGGYSLDGGAQKDIYLFSCFNRRCTLTLMPQKLYDGRAGHIAILVDDAWIMYQVTSIREEECVF